ncbi:hypothetical protein [Streptomyces sp. NPDC054958]
MTTNPDLTDNALDAACATVAAEIARTNSKASLLLAFDGAVLAGLASAAGKKLPLVTQLVGAGAALVLAAAAVLLLLVVRPNLGGRSRAVREGFSALGPAGGGRAADRTAGRHPRDSRPGAVDHRGP